ncbi:MAG: hypothetical protein HKN42_02060 [Granulosicoccus sp.]|nr:hypothetical protein [Granulosicoccus sp.]
MIQTRKTTWLLAGWMLLCIPAQADNLEVAMSAAPGVVNHRIPDATLHRILDNAGVLPQLSTLATTIIGESRAQWQSCSPMTVSVDTWIRQAMSSDLMTQHAVDALRDELDASTVAAVIVWLESAPGQAITRAEHASASLSDAEFNHLFSTLGETPGYRKERAPRIKALLHSTRAAEFVTVLNSELDTLVQLASACSPTRGAIRELLSAASSQRQDLELVTLIMGINLQAPTAVIYRDVDDAVIDAYLEFASSTAGKAYHAALIKVTSDTLVERLEAFATWRER